MSSFNNKVFSSTITYVTNMCTEADEKPDYP